MPNPTTVSGADLYGDMHREPTVSGEVERVARLADELRGVSDALGYLEDFTVREVDLHMDRSLARKIIREAADALQALRVEPPSDVAPGEVEGLMAVYQSKLAERYKRERDEAQRQIAERDEVLREARGYVEQAGFRHYNVSELLAKLSTLIGNED